MAFLRLSRAALICAAFAATTLQMMAQTGGSITGTVKDPTGAVVPNAQVSLQETGTGQSRTVVTDANGQFRVANLAPRHYRVSISRPGFKVAEREIDINATRNVTLDVELEIETVVADIDVSSKGAIRANTDPVYRRLRQDLTFETYSVSNLTLARDVGKLTFRTGRLSFRVPVEGRVVSAVFIGDGEFTLKPALGVEENYLRLVTDKPEVSETFDKLVLCFTDETYSEIQRQARGGDAGIHPADADPRAADVMRDFRKRMRSRNERPRSQLESLLANEDIENLDAETLADIYNPDRPGFFMAFINGRPFGDLRYVVRPRGAVPQILSPEEVALINYDPEGQREGIIYFSHFQQELQSGKASSEEDKRIIDVQHYRIETVIDGDKLTATAEIEFVALGAGDRVLGFGLLPSLRVNRVTFANNEIHYIQEPRKEDGAFYAILPEPVVKGKIYKINIDYEGNKVIADEGGGNFAVGARTSWYPSVNAFNDRATFDLTFKVRKQYTLVSVGKEVKNWEEGNFAASQWISHVPLAVAGFNYGRFKKKAIVDEPTKYGIEGYATSELPSYLRDAGDAIGAMTPARLTDRAIVEAQNSVRLFTLWFGEAPYGRIAITQQPEPNFGQSWPTLVYLPIISFFDSTQRWMMMGSISSQLNEFIDEVTPHEVSHQWWGHLVGWASYHDQWLSEGFADFSAGLYLQMTEPKPDKYIQYWQHAREKILDKNAFGHRANDAGPIWMGLRLNTYKTGGAYNRIVYAKGGYILHMLRTMMWDSKTRDAKFMEMMHDFVDTYTHRNASTEGFARIVDKHMTPEMDLDGNGRMAWFFKEWVYGTEIPKYRLQYSLTKEKEGTFLLKGALTQSEVSDEFKMIVPVYLEIDGNIVRFGTMSIQGNRTNEFQARLQQKPKRVLINAFHDVLASESISEQK